VLDLREPDEWLPPRLGQEALDEIVARGIERLHLPVKDTRSPTLKTLDSAVAFIDDALASPTSRVYVHCRAGMERTACILVAWYARTNAVGYDTALAGLRRGRSELWPNLLQEEVARDWIARHVETATA